MVQLMEASSHVNVHENKSVVEYNLLNLLSLNLSVLNFVPGHPRGSISNYGS
jgi:hypothetical protein